MTIDCLVSKIHNRNKAKISIKKLLAFFEIEKVDKEVLLLSIDSQFTDFEDAVQYYSGQLVGFESIVTRNIDDYKKAVYPTYSPVNYGK
ncbi:MAG: hypothetical protein KAH22_06705 [Thiotrichaceae bacterium]|nr:hypothetical protein [Thiotrichaceae bacterium]